jgi:Tfp pilus assembly protein PilV
MSPANPSTPRFSRLRPRGRLPITPAMGGRHSRSRTSDDAGFALVETIVSAVVLLVIALATLAAVDRAQSTSGFGKNRSVAAALAEQDQARLRGLPTASLSSYRFNHASSRAVNVNGLNYTVASTVDWIRDSTGGTQSCTSDTSQAEYLKMTSTVSANAIKPVTITSLDSAPLAYSSGRGTLAVKVLDGADQPVTGLVVNISGGVSASDSTNSVGCAVFPLIPAGTYHVTYQVSGWVDELGTNAIDQTKIVNAGATALLPLHYDVAGALTMKFETNLGTATAPVMSPSRGWTGSGYNTGVPGGGLRPFPVVASAPMQPTLALTNLYPFRTVYQTFAGRCTGANPETAIPSTGWFAAGGLGTDDAVLVPPGNNSGVVTVRQPALAVQARAGTAASWTIVTTAANGPVNVLITPKDTNCVPATMGAIGTWTIGTNPVQASGGWVTKPSFDFGAPTGVVSYDPGVPFGKYDVCVDAITGTGTSKLRRKGTLSNVNVNDPAGFNPGPVYIPTTGSTSSQC